MDNSFFDALNKLKSGDHLAFIYETIEECKNVLVPFVKAGLEKGEKIIFILPSFIPSDGRNTIEDVIKDLEVNEKQCLFIDITSQSDDFNVDFVISSLLSAGEKSIQDGYLSIRLIYDMNWLLHAEKCKDRLIEFESSLNIDFISKYKSISLCHYKKSMIKGEVLKAVIMIHRFIIKNDNIYDNFYYISPERLLCENRDEIEAEEWLNNIRERKKINDFIKDSELRYRKLFEEARDAIFVADTETGVLIDGNKQAEKLLKLPLEKIIGKHQTFLHPEGETQYYRKLFSEHIESGGKIPVKAEVVTFDGEKIPVEINSSIIEMSDGRTLIHGIFRDVTQIRKIEEEQKLLTSIIENAADFVGVVDANGKTIYLNSAGRDFMGIASGNEIYKKIPDYHTPEVTSKIVNEYIPMAIKEGSWKGETSLLNIDGKEVPVSQVIIPHKNEKGDVKYFSTIIRDIAERKLIEEDLRKAKSDAEKANKYKSEFLANMSHEIRTPLNGVIGMLGLLLDTELAEEQQDFAVTAKKSANALLTIVNDILDFSKIEAGKLQFDKTEFNLIDIIEETVDMLSFNARAKGIELLYVINRDVPHMLKGDPGRLRQIIINLLNNAIKFTSKGEVLLRVEYFAGEKDAVTLKFSITDTGIGIPGERMDRLFKPFSQADMSTTRKYGGTGLGLAISKSLCEMMGGSIGVESQEGKGTKFWFTCVFEKQSHGENIPDEYIIQSDLSNIKVLIVDDSKTNRSVIKKQLRAFRMIVDEAENGNEALVKLRKALSEVPFHIAIIDKMMPGMDGLELGKIVKEDPFLNKTILIMLTSWAKPEDVKFIYDVGFASYITRPVKRIHLYNAISIALGLNVSEKEVSSQVISRKKNKGKIRVLIAEDNVVNQKLALRLLEKRGYHADVVSDGKEAFEAIKNISYDVILMDIQMPEMDGLEATGLIRERERSLGGHIPIIAMTAHAMKEDVKKCFNAGMDDYISKPVNAKDLFAAIESQIADKDDFASSCSIGERKVIIFDREHLLNRLGNDMELFREILKIFLDKISYIIENLKKAYRNSDLNLIKRYIHTIKGASGNAGAMEINKTAILIENGLEKNDFETMAECIAKLDEQLCGFSDVVKSEL